jgi:hypothetical protein
VRRILQGPAAAAAVVLLAVVLLAGGCASIGSEFPAERVSEIEIGRTTRPEIVEMFGNPWRTGIEDGQVKWTYGRYRVSLFGGGRAKDLALRFDDKGVVTSYSFNTTEPDATGAPK